VWIHRQPAGASPVATRRRELSRPTRLRWLNGRRDDTEAWDAYEAPAGRPLVDLLQTPQPWRAVRFWLHDLATEFHTGQQHESPAPKLQPDHVWVRADGQAVVLDFPCPGLGSEAGGADAAATDLASLQGLLHRIAADARHGRDGKGKLTECPPPLPARAFLERLSAHAFDSAELLRGNLESLVRQPAVAPANLRANAVLLPGGLALGFGVLVMFMQHHYERRWDAEWARLFPGKASMQGALVESPTMTEARQKTLRLYLGGEFADVLTNKVFWENPHLGGGMEEHNRESLTNALVTASLATPAELAAARTAGPVILTELRGVQARNLWVGGPECRRRNDCAWGGRFVAGHADHRAAAPVAGDGFGGGGPPRRAGVARTSALALAGGLDARLPLGVCCVLPDGIAGHRHAPDGQSGRGGARRPLHLACGAGASGDCPGIPVAQLERQALRDLRRAAMSAMLRSGQISTCIPSSTTRLAGRPK
jgi:hypothetical protein